MDGGHCMAPFGNSPSLNKSYIKVSDMLEIAVICMCVCGLQCVRM